MVLYCVRYLKSLNCIISKHSKGTMMVLYCIRYLKSLNSFPPNDAIWCHHGHGLSISLWELIYGEFTIYFST